MKNYFRIHGVFSALFLSGAVLSALFSIPLTVRAADDLEVSGWIPYWSESAGTKDARKHLDTLSVIFPFAYAVKNDGSLNDLAGLKKSPWKSLFPAAKKKDVLVIPTVMWSNTYVMHTILSDEKTRKAHIKNIVSMVTKGGYDGVDIDYEGKSAETYGAFALFLKELKKGLGKNKVLSCTIEARTPPDSLYTTIPTDLRYANDYGAIATYCDRVNIMTYDQQRADLKLNKEKTGSTYAPLSDVDWVRKVLELTTQTISADMLSLGVATYGHEYEVVVYPNGYREYNKVRALNAPAILKLAKKYNVTPSRNSAGEMGFSYYPSKHGAQFSVETQVPKNTPSSELIEKKTVAYVNQTGSPATFYYVSWSDAEAIKQKVDLAHEFGLAGVAIFKIDGSEDPAIWKMLTNN